MDDKVGVGIIGAGVISGVYLRNLTTKWPHLAVIGIADIVPEKAESRAEEFGIRAMTIDELLADPDVRIVLNLTVPAAHAEVAMQAIDAGKSVHTEKPLALNREDAVRILRRAEGGGVLVGAAPDTFLGAGLQTARRLIDEGLIGEPVAFHARMTSHGHESWHPDPHFYYQPGAGPMLDMGPYYLTAAVALLGPVDTIYARARTTFPTRTITSQPRVGETIEVNTHTHFETSLQLESGVLGTLMTTFDLWDTEYTHMTIYGSHGTLRLPDPNGFGGPLSFLRGGEQAWEDVPLDAGFTDDARGAGVADMATALLTGAPQRTSGALGYHVLDVMLGMLDSAEDHREVHVTSSVERPLPLNVD